MTSLSKETHRAIPVLRRIVLNPRNAGMRVLHDVEYPGQWPAIVTVDEWRRLSVMLNNPDHRRATDHAVRRWLGAGVYVCDRCDRPVKSATNSAGRGRGYYPVYRCLPGDGGCGRSWKAAPLDEWITTLVDGRLSLPDVADLLPVHGPDMQALVNERTELRRRQTTLATAYMSVGMTDADFQEATRVARERLAEIDRLVDADDAHATLRAVLRHDDPVAAWRALGTVSERQDVVRSLMAVRLSAPPRGRGRAVFNDAVGGQSRWAGDMRTWAEIWAEKVLTA